MTRPLHETYNKETVKHHQNPSTMQPILPITLLLFAITFTACGQASRGETQAAPVPKPRLVGGPCEGCEAIFENTGEPAWIDTLAGPEEPGERMIIRGVVFQPDGRTPAPGIVLYVYHTNAEGRYATRGDETGWGRRHGYLRGWMRTDAQGRYEMVSIRPASYPNSRVSQHIHPVIYEPVAGMYYYIDEFVFDDDPMLTNAERKRPDPRGGRGVVTLVKNRKGIWEGTRDIVLGLNVPGYPRPTGSRATSGPPRYLLAPPGEPGEPLELRFRVLDKTSGRPIPHAEALFYQATDKGAYNPSDPKDESTAHLHTTACTDSNGQFLLSTIRPGEYPDGPKGSRHIHLHYLRAPGYQEIGRVINFDNNVNEEIREWGRRTGFGVVADIQKKGGTWTGEIILNLEKNLSESTGTNLTDPKTLPATLNQTTDTDPDWRFLTLPDAEKILGKKAQLTTDSSSIGEGISTRSCAYTALEKDPVSGKPTAVYFMSEQYSRAAAAQKVYAGIFDSNKNHAGIQVLSNLGDEAYFHGSEHFYFILVRKGAHMFRMKVNRVTRNTSLDEFNAVAKKMAQSL